MGMELEFNEEVFKWDNGLLKSVADHRQYRCITLPNGLKALLIHDPEIQVDNSHKDDDDDDDKDNSDANGDEEINRVQGKEEKGGKSSALNGDKKSHVTPRKRWRTSTNAITALRRMRGMAAETERGKAQKDASPSSEEAKDKSNANPLRRWRTSTATITAIRRLEELVAQTERMRAKTAHIHDSSERTQSADKEGAAVTGGVKGTKAVPVAEVAAPAAVPDSSSKDMVAECSALDDDSPSGTVESKMPSKELRSTQETEKEKIGEADETTVPECEAEGDESSVNDEVEENGKEKEDEPGFTKDAAVAICIKIGSIYDPEDSYGLAHFLEHMLFMGSEKFPEEDEYDSFLSEHGGGSNACTAMDYTCYYFVVDQDHLRPALERFSQFFVSPLLRQDAIEREVLAVESGAMLIFSVSFQF
ncbi:hypothetical protein CBR_g49621 [Chara braunii]|uniref:Peptidase M16 N-terminal domain-containing protein n=1 Tax=Chara braunii TaxID=69332 RepID=A0A388M5A6_CHABU|nr:hypothetical protein CBR_g49621 [Chara braunii]|eukprot:GBG89768.1 hypothetical protein CBR_g49621 [Chara braunii]